MNESKILKTHSVALLISIAIGFIIAVPPVIFQLSKEYKGFPMMRWNTETHYVAEAKEIYDGHYGLGNPWAADLKDTPYVFPPFGPYLIAGFGKLFHLDIAIAVMAFRFFATALLAFFIYLFVCDLTGSRRLAWIAAPFVMLGYGLIDTAHIMEIIRARGIPAGWGFIDYGRPVNPQVSSLLFFSYLFCFWRALYVAKENWRRWGVAAALILGASFYAYLFTWTYIFALNVALILVALIRKDKEKVKRIVWISGGGALVGIPYVWHTYVVAQHQWYAETATRFGFVHTRAPNISRLMVAVAIAIAASWRRLTKNEQFFLPAFLIAGFVAVNEQVITNQFVYNHHYHWYYNTPLAAIALLVVIARQALLFHIQPMLWKAAPFLAIGFFLLFGVAVQARAYQEFLPQTIEDQRYAPLLAWLNAGTPKDSIVFTPPPISIWIAALTHNNVYHEGTVIYTLIPNDRLFDHYLLYLYLNGTPKNGIREYLESHRDDISGFVYGYTYSFIPGVCYGCFPDSVIDALVRKYEAISDGNFIATLKKYPADYIIWDKEKNPAWRIDRFGLPIASRFGEIVVYSLVHPFFSSFVSQ